MIRSLFNTITPFCSALMVLIVTSCVYNQHLLNDEPEHLSWPATVLYAKEAFKEDHSRLQQFETLKSDELITLMDGYVLLQHYSGRLYEYAGDTSFVVAIAVEHTPKDDQTIPVKLDFLFSEYPYKNDRGSPMRPNWQPSYTYLYPYDQRLDISRNELICLWWKPIDFKSNPDTEVKIVFKNVYDDELSAFRTDHRRLEIRLPEHITEELLVIDLSGASAFAPDIGLMIKEKQPDVTPCNATESIEFLYIATRLERNKHYKEAFEFYERAAQASPYPIYDQLKRKALQRLF